MARRTISRRAVLAGLAGAPAGLALACSSGPRRVSPSPSPSAVPAGSPAPPTALAVVTPAVPRPTATVQRSGGTARIAAARSFSFDTLASDLADDVSALEVLGRTHSRLFQWDDFGAGTLTPDLASSLETPDERTLILQLDPRARWHPGVAGGEVVTPEHVRDWLTATIQRARGGGASPSAARREQDWATFEQAGVVNGRVVVRLSRPDPFALMTLASRFALVEHPRLLGRAGNAVTQADEVGGSGPFIVDRVGSTLAFKAYLGGHAAPSLDMLEVSEPAEVRARFIAGDLEEATLRDRRDLPAVQAAGVDFLWHSWFEDAPVVSTISTGAAPWDDARLRRALSAALNRGELARRLFGGRAEPAGLLAPVHVAGALAGRDVTGFDGYRARLEDDHAEARALWAAAGGGALGRITVDFPAVFDPAFSASSVVIDLLNEGTGSGQFLPAVESYTTIAKKAAEGRYGNGRAAFWFGWGPNFAEPDPSRWLADTYGGRGPTLSRLAAPLATTMAHEARWRSARDLERAALTDASGGILHWLVQRHERVRLTGLTRPVEATGWWAEHHDRRLGRS